MARVTVGVSGSTSEITVNQAAATQYVTPQQYGAVADGVTDDSTAVQNAYDAAVAAGRPLLFQSGHTYLFKHLNCSGNRFRIIIEQNATVKLAGDDGDAGTSYLGLFYISGTNGRIDNYGTMDGNSPGQTVWANVYNSPLIATITTASVGFVYDGHWQGRMTNCAGTAIQVTNGSDWRIVNCQIDNANLKSLGIVDGAAVWAQGSARLNINGLYVKDSPSWGLRVIGLPTNTPNNMEAAHLNDILVDLRGIAFGAIASAGGIEINDVDQSHGPNYLGMTISNITVFAPDSCTSAFNGTFGVSIDVAPDSSLVLSNINIVGTSSAHCFDYGLELSECECSASAIMIEGCQIGILCGGNEQTIQATMRNVQSYAVHNVRAGLVMLDLAATDCSAGTALITLQNIVGRPQMVAKVVAIYETVNSDSYVASAFAGDLTLHDCYIVNAMSGSHFVQVAADDVCAVLNSTFIGKGDVGSAIVMTGTGNRIIGNHFKDYSKPWDTSGGARTLIATNLVESCTTSTGATAGTDTAASNMSF